MVISTTKNYFSPQGPCHSGAVLGCMYSFPSTEESCQTGRCRSVPAPPFGRQSQSARTHTESCAMLSMTAEEKIEYVMFKISSCKAGQGI